MLDALATGIKDKGVKGLTAPELSRCRQFYIVYPQIGQAVSDYLKSLPGYKNLQVSWVMEEQHKPDMAIAPLLGTSILGTVSQELDKEEKLALSAEKIINGLSFSHLVELIKIDDHLKRAYYELITVKNQLSVRELRKQINSLSFERTGLSKNKELSLQKIAASVSPQKPAEMIKDLYVFDFLNLSNYSGIEESDIETALLNHLQEFLLELGHGFCFEARQRKLLIGDEYYFIDLVFYNRILKCHVLVDLKVEAFTHNNAGQLNTYLNYYKKEVMEPGDNLPVGILMVTDKNKALVEYATAGMDNQLFVSKYLVQLPSKEQLLYFVEMELRKV